MNPFSALETSSDTSDAADEKVERAKTANKGVSASKGAKAKASNPSNAVASLPRSEDEIKQRQKKQIAQQKEKKAIQQKANQLPSSAVPGVKKGPLAGVLSKEGGNPKHANRPHDRQSGTGRGKEVQKRGAGAANWGSNDGRQTLNDEDAAERIAQAEKSEEVAEAETPKVEEPAEPPRMTLEQYEELKKSKRTGKAFEELKPRNIVENEAKGKAYRKPKNADDAEVLIKITTEQQTNAKEESAPTEKKEKKSVQKLEFIGVPTAKKEPRSEGYANRPPREAGSRGRGAPRGSPRDGRGSFRGGRGDTRNAAPVINTNDESAFPKLGA